MTQNVGKVASLVEIASLRARSPIEEVGLQPPPVQPPETVAADCRLVIVQDPDSGTFLYQALDRLTGEVVRQLPREELLRWRGDPSYVPGGLIDATA